MTRRDYVLLSHALSKAAAARKLTPIVMGRDERDYVKLGVRLAAEKIAEALADKNPGGFDSARFLKDAGVV